MKIYTNELGHMTNIAAIPIYGKNLKNLLLQNGVSGGAMVLGKLPMPGRPTN